MLNKFKATIKNLLNNISWGKTRPTVDLALLAEMFPSNYFEDVVKKGAPKKHEEIIAEYSKKCGHELLNKHIFIVSEPSTENLGKTGESFAVTKKIVIKNLIFECPYLPAPVELSAKGGNTSPVRGRNQLNHLVLENNLFKYDTSDGGENTYIQFILRNNSYLTLKKNVFKFVDLGCFLHSNQYNFLNLTKNKLKQNYLILVSYADKGHRGARGGEFWAVDGDFVSDSSGIKKLEEFINHAVDRDEYEKLENLTLKIEGPERHDTKDLLDHDYYNKKQIKVSRDDLLPIPNNSYIKVKDNTIQKLSTRVSTSAEIVGKNKIDAVISGTRGNEYTFEPETKIEDIASNLYWGAYNKVNSKAGFALGNLGFFLSLKNRAIARKDKHQESIINRELLKCEEALRKDEPISKSWQERLIFWFGRFASNHGKSLMRPFLIILIGNLFVAAMIIQFFPNIFSWDIFPQIYLTLFNPLSWNLLNPASMGLISSIGNLGVKIEDIPSGLLLINLIQKAFLYLLIYELIRVGRRFIVK